MASLRGATLALLGGMVGTIAVAVAFTGCSSDDSGNPVADGGGSDGTTDSNTPEAAREAAGDATGVDVTTGDAHDGGVGEAGPDVVTADARDGAPEADARLVDAEAGSADADASTADGDAGLSDADSGAADADAADVKIIPPGLLAYPQEYATAICTGFAACCGVTFDVATCETQFMTIGYDNTLPLSPATYDAGNLTFDTTQANACITALHAWPCAATLTSAQNQAILTACHGVLGGTIPIGGTGCISSFECAGGAYCNTGGTCTALAADGGSCTPGESPDYQCSHIGTAQPSLYCNIYPGDGGLNPTGACSPAQPDGVTSLCSDGVNFYSDYACTGRVCDINNAGNCAPTVTNPADPTAGFECLTYVLIDAGGD